VLFGVSSADDVRKALLQTWPTGRASLGRVGHASAR
jgi:hypothetical protein